MPNGAGPGSDAGDGDPRRSGAGAESPAADSGRRADRGAAAGGGRVRRRAQGRADRPVHPDAAQPRGDVPGPCARRLPALQDPAHAAAERVRDPDGGAQLDAAVRVGGALSDCHRGRGDPRRGPGDRRAAPARRDDRRRGHSLRLLRRAAAHAGGRRCGLCAHGRGLRRGRGDGHGGHRRLLHDAGDGAQHRADAGARQRRAAAAGPGQ